LSIWRSQQGSLPEVLLLLNERGITQHVVAEVWLNGRWVVVDPAFGLAMKDENGRWLTKED
jgi:transglutaminase-like putative cysteine protease